VPFHVGRRELRQIARRGTFGDLALRIECRSVAFAVKSMVVLRFQRAFSMGAKRGKRGQFIALADHKKTQVTETFIYIPLAAYLATGPASINCSAL